MDADLLYMQKGPTAAAKWQLLPQAAREIACFEFKMTMLSGSQEWEMTNCKIDILADGRMLISAQISMRLGEFGFILFPRAKKIVLVDFHLYQGSFASILVSEGPSH